VSSPRAASAQASRGELGINAVLNTGGSVGYYVAMVVATPAAIQHLGDAGWGAWQIVGATSAYALLLNLGLSSAIAFHVSGALARGDTDAVGAAISSARALLLLSTAFVLGALALGGAPLVASLVDEPLFADTFRTLCVCVAITAALIPASIFTSVIAGLQRFALLASFRLGAGLSILAIAWIGLPLGLGLLGFALWMTFASNLPVLASWLAARRLLPRDCFRWRRLDRPLSRQMLGYSLSTLLYTTGLALLYQGLKFMASWRSGGLVAAGHMGLVVSLVQTLSVIFVPLAAVLQPRVSQLHASGQDAAIPPLLRGSLRACAMLAVPAVAFALLETDTILRAWVGRAVDEEAIREMARTARWMLVGQGLYATFLPSFYALLGIGQHRLFGLGMLASGALTIALGWLATEGSPTLEPLGLAFGVSVTALVLLGTTPMALARFSIGPIEGILRPLALPLLCIAPGVLAVGLRPRSAVALLDLGLALALFALGALPLWAWFARRLLRDGLRRGACA
jgi:O-antigen/teichoic acid export membrane protein